jgi:VanZ family protein
MKNNSQIANTKIVKSVVLGISTIIWTCIIFSFSMQTAPESNRISGGLLKQILGIFYSFTNISIDKDQVLNIFRKFAHYTEFFVLGIFATLFFVALNRDKLDKGTVNPYLYTIVYGVLIAISDETIQFFTGAGRAMRVTDMLIDSSGVLTSLLIIWRIVEI